jgi:hypothetical protein
MRSNVFTHVVGLCAAALSVGCLERQEEPNWVVESYRDAFHFEVQPDFWTPDGIAVDTNGTGVSLTGLDAQVSHIEACLQRNFPTGAVAGTGADCRSGEFEPLIDRSSFAVVVDPNYGHSCSTGEEVTSVLAPKEGCAAKGLTGSDPNCPCRWRAGFQDEPMPTIVITPSARMFPDPLVRFVTGCVNPWANPQFAECVSPTVPLPQQ